MYKRQPQTRFLRVPHLEEWIESKSFKNQSRNLNIAFLFFHPKSLNSFQKKIKNHFPRSEVFCPGGANEPHHVAHSLFELLAQIDQSGFDLILGEDFPNETAEAVAIQDRIEKASDLESNHPL